MMNRLLILGVLALSSCGALLNNLDGPVTPTGSLQIQVVSPNTRGLGTVVPDLTFQVNSYRLSVGTDVRTSLIQGDLASQTGYTPGTYTLQVEALNAGGQVIMTHIPVSVTITSGANTPVSINLSGTQVGTGSAQVRFNLGSLGLGAVSDVKVRWATTVAGLGLATPTDLLAPLNDGQEYIEYINTSLSSGISYLQFHFYGFDAAGGVGTAFAYSPLLTLVIFDNAESSMGYNISDTELDGRPLAPTAPTAPVLLLAPAPHNGNYLQLNWTDNSMVETGYRIYRKLAIDTVYPSTPLAELLPNKTTWEEPTIQPAQGSYAALVKGEIYTYKIVAFTPQYPQGSALEVTTPALEPKMVLSARSVLVGNADIPVSWETPTNVFNVSFDGVMGVFTDSPTPKTYNLAISNEGLWPLTLSNLQISGPTSGDYLTSSLYGFDFTLLANQSYPQNIASGDFIFVELRWFPLASGTRTSTLEVNGDDPLNCPGGISAKLYLQGESTIINDYAGRWDLDPTLGQGGITGLGPFSLANRATVPSANLTIGTTVSRPVDRLSSPLVNGSYLMGGNGTDFLEVASGNPFTLASGGSITLWAGGYQPMPSMTRTLINTFNVGSTEGFALEINTDSGNNPFWRLRSSGNSDLTMAYGGELSQKWNLVSLVYAAPSKTYDLKVDGVSIFSWTTSNAMLHTIGAAIGFGSRPADPSINHVNQWIGSLDDFRIYNRPLNGDDLAALRIEEGYVPDDTPPNNNNSVYIIKAIAGSIFINWDLSSYSPGEVSGIKVEAYRTFPSVGPVMVFNYNQVQPPGGEQMVPVGGSVGDVFTVAVSVIDGNYNLSSPQIMAGITMADSGNVNPSGEFRFEGNTFQVEASTDNGSTWNPLHGISGISEVALNGAGGGNLKIRLGSVPGVVSDCRWYYDGGEYVNSVTYQDGDLSTGTLSPGLHSVVLEIKILGRWYSASATFAVTE